MASAVLRDKIGGMETLTVSVGQTARDVLRANGIPANSVLTFVNGQPRAEDVVVMAPDDHIEFRQVRHYDLDVTRRPPKRVFSGVDPVYSKSVLFDEGGSIEVQSEQFGSEAFATYVEQTFVESILERTVIPKGGRIAIGLSGGRDSVAFLALLRRTIDKLPDFDMLAVTVTGLPDWEEPATFGAAVAACEALGIEHVIVGADDIVEAFQLARPFVEVMNAVVTSQSRNDVMMVTHQIMRRMIEIAAEQRDIDSVALGLNADDLVATLVTWFTSGFRMGAIPVRQLGPFTYSFPLYRLTKKELTLYLELTDAELNRQGAPGRFTTGAGERSLAYAITDHLYDLWPGIDYYLFAAFDNVQKSMTPTSERACAACGATMVDQAGAQTPELCDVCDLFSRQELSLVR